MDQPPVTRRRRGARALALPAVLVGLAAGCGARAVPPAARLYTLYDLLPAAAAGQAVAATPTFAGFPATKFVTPAPGGGGELTPGHGFIEGQPAAWVTTELWVHFDEVWAQPLYRATRGGALIGGAGADAPWVFGVGPRTLFYSPFWDVYGFEVPAGVAPGTILDARAVIELGNAAGGFQALAPRITSLSPGGVTGPSQLPDATYVDDLGAWYGSPNHRFVDFGAGGFRADASAVVRETPFFVFASQGAGGVFQPLGFPGVGGTRPLFSGAPALTGGAGGAGGADTGAEVTARPSFGGLWRVHWVLPFNPILGADGRVTDCLPSSRCLTLDSQAAIEELGADRIVPSEILTATELLQLGDETFSAAAYAEQGSGP